MMDKLILFSLFKNYKFSLDNKINKNKKSDKINKNFINFKEWNINIKHKNLIEDENLNLFYGSGTVVLDEIFLSINS